MAKRILLIIFTMLGSNYAASAQEHWVYTNEGSYYVSIDYIGQNNGQVICNKIFKENAKRWNLMYITKLSNGQWECVNKMLSHYKCTKGDSFNIIITFPPDGQRGIAFYCDFTSNTEYQWWALSVAGPLNGKW
jgi:hypothetical protein